MVSHNAPLRRGHNKYTVSPKTTWHTTIFSCQPIFTRSSAIALGPRVRASCQLKSCQLPRNSAETTCTTSPEQIEVMKLDGYSRRQCVINMCCALNHTAIESLPSSYRCHKQTDYGPSCGYHLYTDNLLWRNMVHQCTKFEVSRFARYEAMNGSAKCRKRGGLGQLGSLKVSRNVTVR